MRKNIERKEEETSVIKSLIEERERMLVSLERKGSQASG